MGEAKRRQAIRVPYPEVDSYEKQIKVIAPCEHRLIVWIKKLLGNLLSINGERQVQGETK